MSQTPALLLSVLLMLSLAACGSGSGSGGSTDGPQAAVAANTQPSGPSPSNPGNQASPPEPEAQPAPTATPAPPAAAPTTPPSSGAAPKAPGPEGAADVEGTPWFPGEPAGPGRRALPESLGSGDPPTPAGPSDGNPTQPVPEPATVILITLGALFIAFLVWRHQQDLRNAHHGSVK